MTTESPSDSKDEHPAFPIALIARRWAAEAQSSGIMAVDIADELVKAAARGEFEFKPEGEWRYKSRRAPAPDNYDRPAPDINVLRAPDNYDLRTQRLIEVFADQPRLKDDQVCYVMAHEIKANLKILEKERGLSQYSARQTLARDLSISVKGLRRWCEGDSFAQWANPLGLKAPSFLLLDKPEIDNAQGEAEPDADAEQKREMHPRVPPDANDDLGQRIRAVLADAQDRRKHNSNISTNSLAVNMTNNPKRECHGFKEGTIRQILRGRYEPARVRKIGGLSTEH